MIKSELNLFITGIGNVGYKVFEEISQNKNFYLKNYNVDLKIIGISNSKKMLFDKNEINFENWKELIKKGEDSDKEKFLKKVIKFNLSNSVFIDNTDSVHIAETYFEYLSNNIHVVTCNKIACSSDYKYYEKLKNQSKFGKSKFLYETTVGSSLPVIETLNNLKKSGAKIVSIVGILSGTLNYIFDNFLKENTFHKVVKNAVDQGFTEPDPKIDLSGSDTARKILILLRENGIFNELSDIKINNFIPERCLKLDGNSKFFNCLEKNKKIFNNLLKESIRKKSKIRYVAEYKHGKAEIGIKMIAKNHHFYNINSIDNAVLFFLENESDPKEVLIGPGAGALVTSKGVINDILKII